PMEAALLDDDERIRAARFRNRRDADLFLYRRILTRIVIGHSLGVPLTDVRLSRRCRRCGHRTHGKPHMMFPPCDLELSVSRTGTVVAVALATGVEIGIDIERR